MNTNIVRMSMVVLAMAMPNLVGCGANPAGGLQPEPMCRADADCDDGVYCNGAETCGADGGCQSEATPCPGRDCDEAKRDCLCGFDRDCDDGVFCNGDETCGTDGLCVAGTDPCPDNGVFCDGTERCDETAAACVSSGDPCAAPEECDESAAACFACMGDSDCDDGVFCNGWEACVSGRCIAGALPCGNGEKCDEDTRLCFAEPVSTTDEILGASWLLVAYACDGTVMARASAFAVGGGLLATNAHVTDGAAEIIRTGGRLAAYQHESGLEVAVSAMWTHPSYTGTFSPDVGVVRAVGLPPLPVLSIASSDTLHNLNYFDEVRLSGFPGELGSIDLIRPRATMLSGHITALRPFDQSAPATPDTAMLIQHDMPTTGGTSGSPVLNSLGEVVAVNNSGSVEGQSNFAVRADALSQLLGWVWSGSAFPLDLTPFSTVVGDGLWTIAWDDPEPNMCIWIDGGAVVMDGDCTEWVDIVDAEILYDQCLPHWSWQNAAGVTIWFDLLPVDDEQFYVRVYADGEFIGTGLMTRLEE